MEDTNREKEVAYMLHSIPGFGNKTLLRLYENFGSCLNICNASENDLRDFITDKQFRAMQKMTNSWDISGEYKDLYIRGIDFYPFFADEYPYRLRDIPDIPFALYCMGKLPDENLPSVSIIGARISSEYGRWAANRLGCELAEKGVQVVSGMARGIDGIAQAAALNAGGDSYAVLGSGVDICYPEENRMLYEALLERGGIISEYLPGTEPKPQYFPPRNRIISGLSDAVIVVEARQKSGTLITVDMALEQGRDVFAIPGRINDSLSSGCNSLIRQGAAIVTGTEDIIEFLKRKNMFPTGPLCSVDESRNAPGTGNKKYELTGIQRAVFEQLDMYPLTTAGVYEKTTEKGLEISVSEVMSVLVELCVLGIVGQNGRGFYVKG